MRESTLSSVNKADEVADAILVRRLTNAGLALIAPWLGVLALSGWEPPLIPNTWAFGAAIANTFAMLAFAGWTVFSGDRKSWRKAFDTANNSKRSENP
jgi:hypothetical protein